MPSLRPQRRNVPQRNTKIRPTVLVTGGSGGIGRALCLAFGTAGWRVGVHYYTSAQAAARTAAMVHQRGGTALLIKADIRDGKQAREMVNQLMDRWGRLDVLICNAGVASRELVLRTDAEAWATVVDTNLTGTFHCLQAAGPVLFKQRDGTVLIVGSLAGAQGTAGQAAYAASKAGLLGLVKTVAKEWGGQNVRVNAVLPGWHNTALAGAAFPDEAPADHVLRRTSSLKEVARIIYQLALLRDSSGQVWNLDSRIT
ncbi:MAG TPA: SDR family oxidoreductase [Nitrospiraceae bacterium]|nr:SDR family oxidoreductase [Nitrospiraceae bacterium]